MVIMRIQRLVVKLIMFATMDGNMTLSVQSLHFLVNQSKLVITGTMLSAKERIPKQKKVTILRDTMSVGHRRHR